MIKINSMVMVTPLGNVPIITKPVDEGMEADEFNKTMDEFAVLLSGEGKFFKTPTQDGKFVIFSKEILANSILQLEIEEVDG